MIKITKLLAGINRRRDLVVADIDKGQFGTGGTAATESDTALETPDATTLKTLTQKTTSTKAAKFNYELLSTEGTTATYREFELQQSTTPVHYTRDVITGISFVNNGTQDLKVTKTVFFR